MLYLVFFSKIIKKKLTSKEIIQYKNNVLKRVMRCSFNCFEITFRIVVLNMELVAQGSTMMFMKQKQ